MTRRYYAGKAQTGAETRSTELRNSGLDQALGVDLWPGTLNVALKDDLRLGRPDVVHGPYHLWKCETATADMVYRNETGFTGWLIRIDGEELPSHFVEVISQFCLRKALKIQNHPSFPVEIGLNCHE